MKVLFFGAGPLGTLYAHLFGKSGVDVTVLDRGDRADWIAENGLRLVNEITGEKDASTPKLIRELHPDDEYDLVIVLVRKNRLGPIIDTLAQCPRIRNFLFMGNNALGLDDYLQQLPADRVLFGFPNAGGGFIDQVLHYADQETPTGKPRAVTLGEVDGKSRERTKEIRALFESAGVPVEVTADIDGWLKYHVALVLPLAGAILKHDGNLRQAANDSDTVRTVIRAAKEAGNIIRALGYRKRQPFNFNLFYWLPEPLLAFPVKGILGSRFAEIAFAMHAKSARDEMQAIGGELQQLAEQTSVETPNLDRIRSYL